MFHEEGASTDVTGTELVANASMIIENGSLTSPVKLKPALEWAPTLLYKACELGYSTEDGINHMVWSVESWLKVVCEGNIKIFQLRS